MRIDSVGIQGYREDEHTHPTTLPFPRPHLRGRSQLPHDSVHDICLRPTCDDDRHRERYTHMRFTPTPLRSRAWVTSGETGSLFPPGKRGAPISISPTTHPCHNTKGIDGTVNKSLRNKILDPMRME